MERRGGPKGERKRKREKGEHTSGDTADLCENRGEEGGDSGPRIRERNTAARSNALLHTLNRVNPSRTLSKREKEGKKEGRKKEKGESR